MQNPIITGAMFKHMLQSAAQAMKAQETKVNELNVFPVPDGDTGSNMARTMSACALAVSSVDGDDDIGQVIQTAATALLRGARGNSGVILSIWMRGMSLVLKDQKKADGIAIAEALISGMEAAYKAVMKPVEGTILTVAKDAASAAVSQAKQSNDAEEVLGAAVMQAKATLSRTPDMLPVLKKAGWLILVGKGWLLSFLLCLLFWKAQKRSWKRWGNPLGLWGRLMSRKRRAFTLIVQN